MNFAATMTRTGRMWEASALRVADALISTNLDGASRYLTGELRGAAPVATGLLRDQIRPIGSGVSRRVQAGPWYAIPVDRGNQAGYRKIAPITSWAQLQLGLSLQNARNLAFAWSRKRSRAALPGKEFWYRTFDRVAPSIQSQFLSPIGMQIVMELNR